MFGWLKSNKKQAVAAQTLTVQSNVIKRPVEKTQEEKDIELMASNEWQNQLVEAQEIWNAKFEELKKIIAELQESQSKVALFICADFFNIPVKLDESVFETSYDKIVIAKLEEILSIEKYRSYMIQKTTKYYGTYVRSIEYYVNEFMILRNSFLNGTINVFKNYLINCEIIINDMPELHGVYRNLKPELNNQDRLNWCAYMNRYAVKKLIGISIKDFYPYDNVLHNYKYFEYNIDYRQFSESAQLFAMQLYAMAAHFEKNEQPSTTTIVGIEFENSLRETLIDEIPDVVVETTPVTGDHGADLLIRVGSVRIAIQAKRYTGIVGNAAVQEIFAAKQFYDADFAMVVTTSRFTNPAKVLAEKLEVTLATESDFIQKINRLLD